MGGLFRNHAVRDRLGSAFPASVERERESEVWDRAALNMRDAQVMQEQAMQEQAMRSIDERGGLDGGGGWSARGVETEHDERVVEKAADTVVAETAETAETDETD